MESAENILHEMRMSSLHGYQLYDRITGRVKIKRNPNPTVVTKLATNMDRPKMPKVMLINRIARSEEITYLIVNDTCDSTMFFDGSTWGPYIEHRFLSLEDIAPALEKALQDKRLIHRFTKVLTEERSVERKVNYSNTKGF